MDHVEPPAPSRQHEPSARAELVGTPGFLWFMLVRFLVLMVQRLQAVSIGWHVYETTRDPLDLAYVGLAMFVPVPLFILLAGDLGDRADRGKVLALAVGAMAATLAGFVAVSSQPVAPIAHLLVLTFLFGTSIVFTKPTMMAIISSVSTPRTLPMAVAWSSLVGQLATIMGPALAGVLLLFGTNAAYWATFLMAAAAVIAAIGLWSARRPAASISSQSMSILSRAVDGLRFVIRTRLVLGVALLDMLAVMLGSVTALLPIFAKDILGGGPLELGLLRAAPALGATLIAIPFTYRPLTRNAGATLLGSVAAFGVSTIVFALSGHFLLSLVALAVAGSADMLGVILRHSILQMATPDALRGRVSAVQQLFISGSTDLGDARAGLSAAWFGAASAALLGGVSVVVISVGFAFLFPSIRRLANTSDARPD